MRELSDVNQLRDATETATDRLVRPQRRRTSCTPTPPLGPESVSVHPGASGKQRILLEADSGWSMGERVLRCPVRAHRGGLGRVRR
jgi:hypothetical protein